MFMFGMVFVVHADTATSSDITVDTNITTGTDTAVSTNTDINIATSIDTVTSTTTDPIIATSSDINIPANNNTNSQNVVVTSTTTTNVHLTIISDTQKIFDADESVSACESSPGSGTFTISGYCAVLQSGVTTDWSWFGTDGFLNSINGIVNDFSNTYTSWSWFDDLNYGSTSLNAHILKPSENLLINYNINPLKLTVSNSNPTQHDTVTLTLNQFGLDSSFNPVWSAATSGTISVNGTSHTVASDGTFLLRLDSAIPYVIYGNETGYVDSNSITLNPTPVQPNENIIIRNGDTVIYQGTIALPATGTIDVIDDASSTHSINADSVLGLLAQIASTTNTFSLSDIQYYAPGSFGPSESFYLKCLKPSGQDALCQNWQYVVGNISPFTSMDSTILSGGENIGIYFGNSHQVIFDTKTILTGDTFTATAQKYNYLDNTWSSLTGVTIGATVPNPNDQWNPIVIATSSVDTNGSAKIKLSTEGTYDVGIVEDYYFPSYSVTVNTPSSGGGGSSSGGGGILPTTFDIPKALNYLSSVQDSSGSFGGSSLYTDWAAIAFGAGNVSNSSRTNLLSYMKANNTASSLLTDNERRSMALMSLGQNPYSFNGTDYITPIVNSFDGKQFGDSSIDNDDIFALIPLGCAGYTSNDSIITKDISFLLDKQQSNGSWDGSVDLTSAAVMALKTYSDVSGVSTAISNAEKYLSSAQGPDGGWGNVSSTSWATQAMNALGDSWTKNGKSTADYFATQQMTDGAALSQSEASQNRIWATSYAIPAVLGKPWSAIMQSVSKQSTTINTGGNSGDTSIDTSTSTILTSTTTVEIPIVATTTNLITQVQIIPDNISTTTATSSKIIISTKQKHKNKIFVKTPKVDLQITQKTTKETNTATTSDENNLTANVLDSGIFTQNTQTTFTPKSGFSILYLIANFFLNSI